MVDSREAESTSEGTSIGLSWIILQLRGHHAPFAFPVGHEDWERVQRAVVHSQSSPDGDGGFIAFDTLNRLEVAVRRREIECAEFVVDRGGSEATGREYRPWTVRLYFTGRVAPYEASLTDYRTFAEFFLQVETTGVLSDAPLRLTHAPDRTVMVNPRRLALALCDSDLLARGEADLLDKTGWRSEHAEAPPVLDDTQPPTDELFGTASGEGPNSCLLNSEFFAERRRDGTHQSSATTTG